MGFGAHLDGYGKSFAAPMFKAWNIQPIAS
jgi:hypothetical protein